MEIVTNDVQVLYYGSWWNGVNKLWKTLKYFESAEYFHEIDARKVVLELSSKMLISVKDISKDSFTTSFTWFCIHRFFLLQM